jgi:hypothetical protein
MPAPQQQPPGALQAIINALRDKVGMGPQQTPGPAVDLMGSNRQLQLQAAEAGMTVPEYMAAQAAQQQQQMPPR